MSGAAKVVKRDPQSAILVALMRGPKKGMTISELAAEIERSRTAVADNVFVMSHQRRYDGGDWVQADDARPMRITLTEKGREVARWRARH